MQHGYVGKISGRPHEKGRCKQRLIIFFVFLFAELSKFCSFNTAKTWILSKHFGKNSLLFFYPSLFFVLCFLCLFIFCCRYLWLLVRSRRLLQRLRFIVLLLLLLNVLFACYHCSIRLLLIFFGDIIWLLTAVICLLILPLILRQFACWCYY